MDWLADECVDASVVAALREVGHDVLYVAEQQPGISDADILDRAAAEQRTLLTEDKDFGDFAFRGGSAATGIVLLRISPAERAMKWPRLRFAIQELGWRLSGRLTVVPQYSLPWGDYAWSTYDVE